jgi:cleavage and polyadenylation specificity factor subunit 1
MRAWFKHFGVPLTLTTDRGTQFESDLFAELSKLIGFHRIRTTSYHPAANGKVERLHRTIKNSLKARKGDWLQALPIVEFAYKITPSSVTGCSPFQLVTGSSVAVPAHMLDNRPIKFNEQFVNNLSKHISELQFSSPNAVSDHLFEPCTMPANLRDCSHVWVRTDRVKRPLEAPYLGPFSVVKRHPKHFIVRIGDREDTISVDRLKPVILRKDANSESVLPVQPNPIPTSPPSANTRSKVKKTVTFKDI